MRFDFNIRRFAGHQSGTIAMLFAITLPGLLGATGLAVDYSSGVRQKSALQSAADSAALNAARELVISEPTLSRVQGVVRQSINATLRTQGIAADWTSDTEVSADRKAIIVKISRPIKPVFGIFNAVFGVSGGIGLVAEARATARLAHNSKLCLLTMGDDNSSVVLRKNARLTGASCSIHSNSRSRDGILLESGSKLTTDLVCSRGGINNSGSTVTSDVLNDCPPVQDPLRYRVPPATTSCKSASRVVYSSGIIPLSPGIYCGGLELNGTARAKMSPGIYVFLNGDLTVKGDAELQGNYVGLFFQGTQSYFRFSENALIELTGPKDGAMSGLLIWRDKIANLSDKSIAKEAKLGNSITANRANKLTGTLYLPEGTLYIGAKAPVAAVSDYTVILARKLEIADGPNLVLNTNYAGSDVPVPQDLGPIGLKDLKLER